MPSTATNRLQGLTTSVAVKPPCKTVTTTSVTLSGEQTVGGVACVTGDRVLVAITGGSVNNGIWTVDTGAWDRAKDFDGSRDVVSGTMVLVAPGSNARFWQVTTTGSIVPGTTVVSFSQLDPAALIGGSTYTLNVADFGALGDGVTDDTTAIQTAINAMVNISVGSKLVFPRQTTTSADPFDVGVYSITSSLTFPAAWVRNQIDFCGCELRYDGAADATAAIFKITKNLFYENVFENGKLDANDLAGYCFYVVGEASLYSIKASTLRNMSLENPTVMNFMLGNQTVTGFDTDAADWHFVKVYFRHITPAIGMQVDGDNILNTSFHHTWWNANSGTYSGGHCRFLRGSGYYMFDTFFGYLGPTSNYCIYLRDGQLGVFGCNTEEGSILKTETMAGERKSIMLANIGVNEGTTSATPEYAIYAPVGQLTVTSATLGKADAYQRKIYAGDSLSASQVYLGSNAAGDVFGTYELDFPDRCYIEGQHLSNVRVLNGNPCMHLWAGTAAGDLPIGYALTGGGTVAVQRSTTGAVQGPYTARLIVSAGYATGNVIDGLQTTIPVAQTTKTGRRSFTAVVRGSVTGLTGATTLKLRVNMIDATGAFVGSNVVSITPSGAGTFVGICSVVGSDVTIAGITAMIGIGTAAASATIYVDNLYIVPAEAFSVNGGAHYKSYVDAWTGYAQPFDGMLEYMKAGQLRGGTMDAPNKITWGTAAPTVGDHRQGDVHFRLDATSGGSAGWSCTVAGTPGTWKAMANLA